MTLFLKEIFQQPQSLRDTLEYYETKEGNEALNNLVKEWESEKYCNIIITGMGSSYFLSTALATMLNERKIPAFAINAGELLHYQHGVVNDETILVCISQSGESYETVSVLKLLSEEGIKPFTVAICNEKNSTLAKTCNILLPTQAGKEEKTSTKTFITAYQVIYMLANAFDGKKVSQEEWNEISESVQEILDNKDIILPGMLKAMGDAEYVQLISRGTTSAAASQCALMVMEASHTPASAQYGGEFRHGPLEMVKPGFLAIVLAHSESNTFTQIEKLVDDILKYEGKVILVTNDSTKVKTDSETLTVVEVKSSTEALFAIPSIIPVQLATEAWALSKGKIPGEFTHGAKVTAIE